MARFASIRTLSILALGGALSACSTPAVERDVAGYDHANYALDLGVCNMNDLVVNTFEGAATAVSSAGVGFLYGAGISGNSHTYHHDPSLEVLLVGGVLGATVGTGVGVYKAVEGITLDADSCMERQGYIVAGDTG